MNRIITAIDEEILELDAKASKLRMLRQAAVSIEEGGGEALVEGAPAREIGAPEPTPIAPAPEPEPEPAPPIAPRKPRARAVRPEVDHSDLDERVYQAIAAAKGAWMSVGPQLGEEIGVSTHQLRGVKERLLEAGRIERKGHRAGMRFRATEFEAPPDPPSTNGKPQESAASESRKAANIGKAKEADERLLAMADQGGVDGVSADQIAIALDVSKMSARGRLRRMVEMGRLVSFDGEGGGKRYRSADLGLLPVDADGCKTGVERKLLEAVQRAPVALTTVEVAANAKVPIVDASRVLHGLAKRGVVRAIPLKTETSPQRWELPKVMAEAA